MKLLIALLLTCSLLPACAQQEQPKLMDPKAHPKFEVATIKLADPDAKGSGFSTSGKNVSVRNKTMSDILAAAFNVHKSQIVNMPAWADTRFDIRGYPDTPGAPSWGQYQEMLHALLEDRFSLRVHHETREMVRVTMQVGRGGIKFAPTKNTGIDLPDQTGNGSAGKQEWRITNNSMDEFAGFLRGFLNHPVLNQTGLTGKYDFTLNWAREEAPTGADTGGYPGLLTALQEQLGLKAESSRGPTDVIVIDHIERPSEN